MILLESVRRLKMRDLALTQACLKPAQSQNPPSRISDEQGPQEMVSNSKNEILPQRGQNTVEIENSGPFPPSPRHAQCLPPQVLVFSYSGSMVPRPWRLGGGGVLCPLHQRVPFSFPPCPAPLTRVTRLSNVFHHLSQVCFESGFCLQRSFTHWHWFSKQIINCTLWRLLILLLSPQCHKPSIRKLKFLTSATWMGRALEKFL